MKNITQPILSEEEQITERMLENGQFKPIKQFDKRKSELEEAAKQFNILNKSKRITLRINNLDLIRLKTKAKDKNIPYQTLLSSLIHQYVEGQITTSPY